MTNKITLMTYKVINNYPKVKLVMTPESLLTYKLMLVMTHKVTINDLQSH